MFKKLGQAQERLFTIWCMVQYANAIDNIEGVFCERQIENICLDNVNLVLCSKVILR